MRSLQTQLLVLLFLATNLYPCDLPGHFDFDIGYYNGCYDANNGGPHYIQYTLKTNRENLNFKRASRFTQNRDGSKLLTTLKANGYKMPVHDDYINSGYERGHMASAESFDWSQEAKNSTFFIANIWPQNGHCNHPGAWYVLEELERTLAIAQDVTVTITVDEFTNEWLKGKVRVPAAFIKTLAYNDTIITYRIPNESGTSRDVSLYKILKTGENYGRRIE
jgi:endonuclease G